MKQYKNRFSKAIRRTAHNRYFCFLLAVIAVGIMSLVYFKDKQMIHSNDIPEIRLISVDYKKDGRYGTLDLSGNEISSNLNDNLVSIFKSVKIRNKLLPGIKSHTVLDGDTHITVKVDLETSSLFVNLYNDSQASSVQWNDKYYHIVNAEILFEDVYRLLFD